MNSVYLKEAISPELKAKFDKYAKNSIKEFLKPCMPNEKMIRVMQADGKMVFELNPDFGVDKIIEKMLPLLNGDKELAKEIIVKEHRKNPDISFQELLDLVQQKLKTKQTAMTTGMREQYIPRNRIYRPEVTEMSEEEAATDIWREQQRLLNLYAAKIKQALKDYAAYDLKKVSKEGPNGTRIIYEGQNTIAGKCVDIDEHGNVLVKIALEYVPDIPDIVKAMINRWFKPYTTARAQAYDVASSVIKKNPNASLDEIGIAIKESFR